MRHSLAQHQFRAQQILNWLETTRHQSQRKPTPRWLGQLLESLCEQIEPLRGEARAGFQLQFKDPLWQIELFLGKNEIVGGSLDGLTDYVSYTANIGELLRIFSRVDRCSWIAVPENRDYGVSQQPSSLVIEGDWQGHQIRVLLRMTPPPSAAIGLKVHQDGSYALS